MPHNKMMVTLMHHLLSNLCVILVENGLFSLQYIMAAVTSLFILFCLTVRTLAARLQIRSYDGSFCQVQSGLQPLLRGKRGSRQMYGTEGPYQVFLWYRLGKYFLPSRKKNLINYTCNVFRKCVCHTCKHFHVKIYT